jgi:DNA (cytosine-5)-methyltransferase 1
MTGATLCSGIRAPEVADPEISWKWAAEIEPFPCAVGAHYWPDVPNLGDIMANDFIERALALGPLDVLVAGTPCQAFSVAGLRGSLSDSRGNLTLRFVEIVDAIQPGSVLWENVPGVLSTPDNAFGCFLGALVGADTALVPAAGQRWTRAGVVDGPKRSAAWRVLDAQYFGLAQRRERVFVVASTRDWTHPAEILFERKGVQRHSPPSRKAGEGVAHDIAPSLTSSGRGVELPGESRGQDPVIAVAFGGNNTGGPVDVATAVNAKGGTGRSDFESETFIATGQGYWSESDVTATLGTEARALYESTAVAHALRAEGFDASEDGTGRGTPLVPVCFDTTQITSAANRSNPKPGDPCHPLAAGAHPPAIAFNLRGREGGAQLEVDPDGLANIRAASGGSSRTYVGAVVNGIKDAIRWAVRRLTPRECERLQGFPDDFTVIQYRGKPAADGPRYKALGNSMAVPVMRWILSRIRSVAEQAERRAA